MDVIPIKKVTVFVLFIIILAFVICLSIRCRALNTLPSEVIPQIINTIEDAEGEGLVIVVDPGHGGFDPGKVGINNILEKDINLQIALKLKECMSKQGIHVIMTRETDTGLYSDNASNKKREDLKNRVILANSCNALAVVSIHQNSYSDHGCKGAQVFYHQNSEQGKLLAGYIQEAFKIIVDPNNHRDIKANDSYYILKETSCPTVIVECGFLSNSEEAALLSTSDYQNKICEAICKAVITYLKP